MQQDKALQHPWTHSQRISKPGPTVLAIWDTTGGLEHKIWLRLIAAPDCARNVWKPIW